MSSWWLYAGAFAVAGNVLLAVEAWRDARAQKKSAFRDCETTP